MIDLAELLAEAADALDAEADAAAAWERRAIYWRQVAAELAAGFREPYPGSLAAAYDALGAQAPGWATWQPGPERPTPLSASYLRRWWSRGPAPLGRRDDEPPRRVTS